MSLLITCLHSQAFTLMPSLSIRQHGKKQRNSGEGKPLSNIRKIKVSNAGYRESFSIINDNEKNVEIARVDTLKHLDM